MAQKILIISPVPLFPGYAGNRVRIRNICSELMQLGYILDFYYTGFDAAIDKAHLDFFNGKVLDHNIEEIPLNAYSRAKELINGFMIRYQNKVRRVSDGQDSERYNKSLSHFKNTRKINLLNRQIIGHTYSAVIINYAVYSFYFDLFDNNTRRILDTHDRLSDRYKLFLDNGNGDKPSDWYSLRPEDERKAIQKADVIWAITDAEKKHYEGLLPNYKTRIRVLRHIIQYNPVPADENNKNILFIGSGNKLNLDSLAWFLGNVWQRLLDRIPGISLVVAGSICNKSELFEAAGVQFYGKYRSAEEVYRKATICINPMLQGTGLKIKTMEAMAHGKVVLSTPEGASGLGDLIGKGLICKEHPEEWVRELSLLFDKPGHIHEVKKMLGPKIDDIYRENLSVIKDSLTSADNKIDGSRVKS